ncbi:MAG: oligopeptidase A [Venatoribacter sp.]
MPFSLPAFSSFNAQATKTELEALLNRNRERITKLIESFSTTSNAPTWASFVAPLQEWNDELNKLWSPMGHLNGVQNSDELREAYNACLPLLSEYSTELGQNQALCALYQAVKDSPEFATLNQAQQKSIDNSLRSFRLGGVDLPADKKARFGDIKKRLSTLTTKFSENVLDATNAWHKTLNSAEQLAGVPDSALGLFAQQAKQAGEEGYRLTLDFPSYHPILTYCENRELREEMYRAYVTRASELSDEGKFDNSAVMQEILALRYELAQLLGFSTYAERSLATKMADTPAEVLSFLNDLAAKAKPQAEREFAELEAFAKEQGANELEPWDVSFYSEKLKQARYAISQEELRPYFPMDKALKGMFEVVKRLYGIDIVEQAQFDSYHGDLRFFHVQKQGEAIAAFYLDPYARAKKRGGAWMDDCRVRRQTVQGVQLPVAYLVCNFSPAVGDTPALLTHDELTTLFHEFGHGLHHMLTAIDVPEVSGINGVAWDAVELPSQFMENWCYQPEALAFISGHYQSGEPLPQALLDKLLAAKNFQSAMFTVRQLEFALFDFRLHQEYRSDNPVDIQALLNQVRQQVSVVPVSPFNRFQHGFSHIFAGGYAAGYYSYKWAEVLSADAFSRFEEEGIFNPETGASFLREILSQGGSQDAAVLFKNFRGRAPSVEPLLRHSGISA